MTSVSIWRCLRYTGSLNTRHMSSLPPRKPPVMNKGSDQPAPKSGKYTPEHDYTITPTFYTYKAEDNMQEFERFPLVNAKVLSRRNERPRKVRMLSREFIDDSMYNPSYGYFSKAAEIFSPEKPFNFSELKNMEQFLDNWSREYKEQAFVTPETKTAPAGAKSRISRQLWHTPSEIFHPHYGRALARHIIQSHGDSQKPLIIYETGAGKGTLMVDILDYIREVDSELYRNTSYKVIEISKSLSLTQRAHSAGHADKVEVINKSIFEWNEVQPDNCFFIALEVWDNLAHDVIRYDNTTNQPYQGYVVVDAAGDFTEIFSSKLDRWAKKTLELRSELENPSYKPARELGYHPQSQPSFLRTIRNAIQPFKGNLSQPEYIPTKFVEMVYVLRDYFPNHKLLVSDFTHFNERIEGYCSPVVQTFMEGAPIPVSTYMTLQGYFDIMFPTDFTLSRQMYEKICQKPVEISQHGQFLRGCAEPDTTVTKSGENLMLTFYQNAAFMYSKDPPTAKSN